MAKRKKRSTKPASEAKPVKLRDPTGEDAIYDEVDKFHLQKDKIMLDMGDEEEEVDELADLEDGVDNEVLAMSDGESDEDDGEEGEDEDEDDDSDEKDPEKDLPSNKAWGRSKKAFYAVDSDSDDAADQGSDEEAIQMQVEEEEREAIVLQKRLTEKLGADDFQVFEQVAEDLSKSTDEQVVKDLSKLSKDEKLEIIIKESPELLGLIEEFREKLGELIDSVHPLMDLLKKGGISDEREGDFIRTRHALLLNYCVNISFYLTLQSGGEVNIKRHPVIERIAQYQQLLAKFETVDENLHKQVARRLRKSRKKSAMTAIQSKANPTKKSNNFSLLDQPKKNGKSIANGHARGASAVDPLEYYKQVEKEAHEKKNKKRTRFEEDDDDDVDISGDDDAEDGGDDEGKRAITYEMKKNKGMTRSRKKELKNPRVKHKMKYKKAQIKRRGQVRDVVTEIHRYGGESTGIKAGLAKSVKLKA